MGMPSCKNEKRRVVVGNRKELAFRDSLNDTPFEGNFSLSKLDTHTKNSENAISQLNVRTTKLNETCTCQF